MTQADDLNSRDRDQLIARIRQLETETEEMRARFSSLLSLWF